MAGAASTRASFWRRRVMHLRVLILLVAASLLAGCWADVAFAQMNQVMTFPTRPEHRPAQPRPRPADEKPPMLLPATEINYDYTNHIVSAAGNVQLYYNASTLEADKITYDENTRRMRAEGNVRLTEPDGKITYSDMMDLSDDFRDGFVDSLRLDTPDKTRMAASSAERTNNNITVFQNGVYTACEPCADNPQRPPLWQVRAARIIHDEQEKMVYYEDA